MSRFFAHFAWASVTSGLLYYSNPTPSSFDCYVNERLKHKSQKDNEFANSLWGTSVGQTLLGLAVKYTSQKQYKSYGLFSTLKVHPQDDPNSTYLTFVGAAGRWHFIEKLSKNIDEKELTSKGGDGRFQIGNLVISWDNPKDQTDKKK